MKKLLIAAFLPVFFLIVLIAGTYFFAKLGLTIGVNKIKQKRIKARLAKAPIKNQVTY